MKSQITLPTHEATRLAKRLSKHWEHKFEVEYTDSAYIIHMTKESDPTAKATVVMTPSDDSLHVTLDGANDTHNKVQEIIINHLARMGENKELGGDWQMLEN